MSNIDVLIVTFQKVNWFQTSQPDGQMLLQSLATIILVVCCWLVIGFTLMMLIFGVFSSIELLLVLICYYWTNLCSGALILLQTQELLQRICYRRPSLCCKFFIWRYFLTFTWLYIEITRCNINAIIIRKITSYFIC